MGCEHKAQVDLIQPEPFSVYLPAAVAGLFKIPQYCHNYIINVASNKFNYPDNHLISTS